MLNFVNGRIEAEGWIREHLLRDKAGICGNLNRLTPEANFRIFETNKVKDEINGSWSSWWPGETEGNWRDAYIRLGYALDDQEIIDDNKEFIDSVLSCQGEDGYIGIFQENERFGNGRRSGELWTQSRIMTCMLSYYKGSEDERIYPALERMVDLIVRQYGPLAEGRSLYEISDEDGSKTHSLMIIDPILAVYDKLKKPEYLEFCEFLYEDYSKYAPNAKFPCFDLGLAAAANPEQPFIGHGPHTCEQFRIPMLLYRYSGNEKYYAVFMSAYAKLNRYRSLSGSCKSDEMIGAFQDYIPEEERTGWNLGESYPLPGAGYEYCSTTELMFSFSAALYQTMDLHYADEEEWLVMNAAMAARRQDGKAILYLCADNLYEATKAVGDRWDYSPTHEDAAVCCAPNSCKIMPFHLQNMWLQDETEELYAMYYGPNTLHTSIGGRKFSITEKTQYPFEHRIQFEIHTEQPVTAALHFRIPEWCEGVILRYNGTEMPAEIVTMGKGRIVRLQSDFAEADEIVMEFQCKPRLLKAVDGTKAAAYGPLLYSLDIPAVGEDYFHYDTEPFCDTNYIPHEGSDWEYTFITEEGQQGKFLQVRLTEGKGYIWEDSPVKLEAVMLSGWSVPKKKELIPIGCTLLRRTAFPWIVKR